MLKLWIENVTFLNGIDVNVAIFILLILQLYYHVSKQQ